jgi:methylenetetrahydrofolate reductase (NADPH)
LKSNSKLANQIQAGKFIVTAEYLPRAGTDGSVIEAAVKHFGGAITAVNVAANHYNIAISSLAASVILSRAGVEPVYQILTRDGNRIALQSDLLGAASLGIKNILCLSGYHQSLTTCRESAHVYDIDSIQLLDSMKKMAAEKILLDGTKIEGDFSMLAGAAANPSLKPIELNILRLAKKVEAGARFIQTQAVFDVEEFHKWLGAAQTEGITERSAVLAGVLPLDSAEEARKLNEKYTDFCIPEAVINRLAQAGDGNAQKKEGLKICAEIITKIKNMKGLRGIHIFSGGKESAVPEILAAAGL